MRQDSEEHTICRADGHNSSHATDPDDLYPCSRRATGPPRSTACATSSRLSRMASCPGQGAISFDAASFSSAGAWRFLWPGRSGWYMYGSNLQRKNRLQLGTRRKRRHHNAENNKCCRDPDQILEIGAELGPCRANLKPRTTTPFVGHRSRRRSIRKDHRPAGDILRPLRGFAPPGVIAAPVLNPQCGHPRRLRAVNATVSVTEAPGATSTSVTVTLIPRQIKDAVE